MHPAGRDLDRSAPTVDRSTEESPALRDARAKADRVAADEADAAEARTRLREAAPPPIEPDTDIVGHLTPGESLHGLRRHAILSTPGAEHTLGYGGSLYLTSARLVHLGQVMISVKLSDIVETALAGERLLLSLRDGEGMTLDLDRPRLFRAELAAAMREGRR